jgi:hypothetical protein
MLRDKGIGLDQRFALISISLIRRISQDSSYTLQSWDCPQDLAVLVGNGTFANPTTSQAAVKWILAISTMAAQTPGATQILRLLL